MQFQNEYDDISNLVTGNWCFPDHFCKSHQAIGPGGNGTFYLIYVVRPAVAADRSPGSCPGHRGARPCAAWLAERAGLYRHQPLAVGLALAGLSGLSQLSFRTYLQIPTTMAKNHNLSRLLFFVALCLCGLLGSSFLSEGGMPSADARHSGTATRHGYADNRARILDIARGEIGVMERSGRNDGDRVGEYLRYTRLGEGYEWCAAFVSWCYGQAGFSQPRTPWSPSLFPLARQLEGVESALFGDVFGIWIREKGRIGHAGLVEVGVRGNSRAISGTSDSYLITIEGNNQDAVRRVRRPIRTIQVVADWVRGLQPDDDLREGGQQ